MCACPTATVDGRGPAWPQALYRPPQEVARGSDGAQVGVGVRTLQVEQPVGPLQRAQQARALEGVLGHGEQGAMDHVHVVVERLGRAVDARQLERLYHLRAGQQRAVGLQRQHMVPAVEGGAVERDLAVIIVDALHGRAVEVG